MKIVKIAKIAKKESDFRLERMAEVANASSENDVIFQTEISPSLHPVSHEIYPEARTKKPKTECSRHSCVLN